MTTGMPTFSCTSTRYRFCNVQCLKKHITLCTFWKKVEEFAHLTPSFWPKMGVSGQRLIFRQIVFYVTIPVAKKHVNVILCT